VGGPYWIQLDDCGQDRVPISNGAPFSVGLSQKEATLDNLDGTPGPEIKPEVMNTIIDHSEPGPTPDPKQQKFVAMHLILKVPPEQPDQYSHLFQAYANVMGQATFN
jgi:hypothetical protein